ncbi:hypothetical protein Tco_0764631 [Tanacetum coccineum]
MRGKRVISRAIFELAIEKPALDMPELLWKTEELFEAVTIVFLGDFNYCLDDISYDEAWDFHFSNVKMYDNCGYFLIQPRWFKKKACPAHLFFSHLFVSDQSSCTIDTVALTRNAEGGYTSLATQTSLSGCALDGLGGAENENREASDANQP